MAVSRITSGTVVSGPMSPEPIEVLVVVPMGTSRKIGDRDLPGTRSHAERKFRESAQVLVATEAAGVQNSYQ